jgi:hypothetical protein
MRDGVTTEERDRIKALEREVRELRQTNEVLRRHQPILLPLFTHASMCCWGVGRSGVRKSKGSGTKTIRSTESERRGIN